MARKQASSCANNQSCLKPKSVLTTSGFLLNWDQNISLHYEELELKYFKNVFTESYLTKPGTTKHLYWVRL